MKNQVIKALSLLTLLAVAFTTASAGSNNGYTTAANVYSGSSSRSWFGGGVEHVLAQWRMEKDVPTGKEAISESTDVVGIDSPSMEHQQDAAPNAGTQPEAVINEATTQ